MLDLSRRHVTFSYFQPDGTKSTKAYANHIVDSSTNADFLALQQYGMNDLKPFTADLSSILFSQGLRRVNRWSIIAGNTYWYNDDRVDLLDGKKGCGTTADLMEDHMLGQYYWDYSWAKIITRIKVTADANLAKKHYENHQWEDQSKHASRFIFYNLYDIEANVANPLDLQARKAKTIGLTFGGIREHSNISSNRKKIWNSCAEPAVHNINFKLHKDSDLFIVVRLMESTLQEDLSFLLLSLILQ